MIPTTTVPDTLTKLATAQAGAISRDQVLRCGLSDRVIARLVRTATWRRLAQGVYATLPDSWEQRVWAGLLIGGPHAVIGGRAAARLWNIRLDSPRRDQPEPPIDVYIGHAHRQMESTPTWRFIRADRVGQQTPPRTSIAQTIVDLAQTMTADELASLLGQCRRRVNLRDITTALAQTSRHRQRALLADILTDADDGVTSALERHYVHDVERAHGLPHAERQAKPISLFAVDNLYRDYGLIVELDSEAWHHGAAATQDFDRDRLHEKNGYLTLRYTWSDVVDNACATADQIAVALSGRGWAGHLSPCPRCAADHVHF
jgi:very-short-patch-repair endonuclease